MDFKPSDETESQQSETLHSNHLPNILGLQSLRPFHNVTEAVKLDPLEDTFIRFAGPVRFISRANAQQDLAPECDLSAISAIPALPMPWLPSLPTTLQFDSEQTCFEPPITKISGYYHGTLDQINSLPNQSTVIGEQQFELEQFPLSERMLTAEDFAHAIDQTIDHRLSMWESN